VSYEELTKYLENKLKHDLDEEQRSFFLKNHIELPHATNALNFVRSTILIIYSREGKANLF